MPKFAGAMLLVIGVFIISRAIAIQAPEGTAAIVKEVGTIKSISGNLVVLADDSGSEGPAGALA